LEVTLTPPKLEPIIGEGHTTAEALAALMLAYAEYAGTAVSAVDDFYAAHGCGHDHGRKRPTLPTGFDITSFPGFTLVLDEGARKWVATLIVAVAPLQPDPNAPGDASAGDA
jgi:hypothetical protein